jgi:hypothetical protein
VVSRVNSVQAAARHGPASFSAIVDIILSSRRKNIAESTEGGNCKRDESLLSTHGPSSGVPSQKRDADGI